VQDERCGSGRIPLAAESRNLRPRLTRAQTALARPRLHLVEQRQHPTSTTARSPSPPKYPRRHASQSPSRLSSTCAARHGASSGRPPDASNTATWRAAAAPARAACVCEAFVNRSRQPTLERTNKAPAFAEGQIHHTLAALRLEGGGAEGDRTPDLLNAIQVLSQLSYRPKTKRPPASASRATCYPRPRAVSTRARRFGRAGLHASSRAASVSSHRRSRP
jgi:hypothetical protein